MFHRNDQGLENFFEFWNPSTISRVIGIWIYYDVSFVMSHPDGVGRDGSRDIPSRRLSRSRPTFFISLTSGTSRPENIQPHPVPWEALGTYIMSHLIYLCYNIHYSIHVEHIHIFQIFNPHQYQSIIQFNQINSKALFNSYYHIVSG